MKPGFDPALDISATVRFTVDETMLAAFDGVVVHRVLGTASLIQHLEHAGRKVILPYLDEGEEGIGHAINVVHRNPAVPGTTVIAAAKLTAITGNRVTCRVEAHDERGTLIADGAFTQVILPKTVIHSRFHQGFH